LSPHIPPLPPNKTVVNVFADYLRYLKECAGKYIRDTHINGARLWTALEDSNDIHYVLSHPNGWEGSEQSQMRKAAVQAGLIRDTQDGHEHVSFVTEGEASLHFAVENRILAHISRVRRCRAVVADETDDVLSEESGSRHC